MSVPSNIAEGSGRASAKEFCHFLSIAAGSASELQYQLELAHALELTDDSWDAIYDSSHEVKRLIWGLHRSATPG